MLSVLCGLSGLGYRNQAVGIRLSGSGCRDQAIRIRLSGSGYQEQAVGIRLSGSGEYYLRNITDMLRISNQNCKKPFLEETNTSKACLKLSCQKYLSLTFDLNHFPLAHHNTQISDVSQNLDLHIFENPRPCQNNIQRTPSPRVFTLS